MRTQRRSGKDQRAPLVEELDRRRRPARIALLLDPPHYLTADLGPLPDGLIARPRWRAAAERLERIRQQLGYGDQRRALPEDIRDPALRQEVARLRAQLELERNAGRQRVLGSRGIER